MLTFINTMILTDLNSLINIDWKLLVGFVFGLILVAVSGWCVIWWKRGKARRRGKLGEKLVAKELARLQKKEFLFINDLMLPASEGRTSQIDHVIISTRGIFIIETKNYSGRISGSEHSQYWQQHLSNRSYTFYNPILQNMGHLKAIKKLFPEIDRGNFSTMVVFTEAWRLDIKADEIVRQRWLLPDRHIRRTLNPEERRKRRWWCPGKEVVLDEHKMATLINGMLDEIKRRPRILSRESLQGIYDKLVKINITDRSERRGHVEYVKKTSEKISSAIRCGICPRCGSQLIIRKSPNGEFAGCSNYPDCRFTCSIDRLGH